MAEQDDMDYHAPGASLAERMRTNHVIRKVDKQAYGFSTLNFHRNERLKHIAFVAMSILMVAAVLVILLT